MNIESLSSDVDVVSGVDSYKPSKSHSLTDTLIDSVGEDAFFNLKSSDNYEDDVDMLEFLCNDVDTPIVEEVIEEECNTDSTDKKSANLYIVIGLLLSITITLIVNILM